MSGTESHVWSQSVIKYVPHQNYSADVPGNLLVGCLVIRQMSQEVTWFADRLRNSLLVRLLDGLRQMTHALMPWGDEKRRLAARAVAIRRLAYTPLNKIARVLWQATVKPQHKSRYSELEVGWHSYGNSLTRTNKGTSTRITTSVVLREPTTRDKGVLYISFEYNWLRLVAHERLSRVMQHFYVVGASSWSPTDFSCLANLSGASEDPFFVGISNQADLAAYRAAAPVIVPVSQLASDWVDPAEFTPRPVSDRDIDIVMVAHWAKWKRHWLLFRALRNLPGRLNVVLVGRDVDGRTADTLLAEARESGVRQQVTVFTNINAKAVRQLLSRSRVSVVLSAREGSCVSVAESLAADCPVACLYESHIGSLKYINERTGRRAHAFSLDRTLMELLESSAELSPREWYSSNSGCWHASKSLDNELANYARSVGRDPVTPIAPLKWSYVPTYARQEDSARLAGAREFLLSECHVEVVDFLPPPPTQQVSIIDPDRPPIKVSSS